jgi:hypothetical protein
MGVCGYKDGEGMVLPVLVEMEWEERIVLPVLAGPADYQ